MTIPLELAGLSLLPEASGQAAAPPTPPALAPADAIPTQAGPLVTISLTQGCEAPLDALKAAPVDHAVRCHPCDEAIVLLLLSRVRRASSSLLVSAAISPGTLCVG